MAGLHVLAAKTCIAGTGRTSPGMTNSEDGQKEKRRPGRPPGLRQVNLERLKASVGLRRAVGGDQPGLTDDGLAAGGTKARGLEIRPGLLRAAAPHGVDVEAVALGERLRRGSFDLRRKARQHRESGGNEGGDGDG